MTPKFPSQVDPVVVPDLAQATPILQSIISHRQLRNKTLYLVLLQDQDPEDAKWVPTELLETFSDPHSIIDVYRTDFFSP